MFIAEEVCYIDGVKVGDRMNWTGSGSKVAETEYKVKRTKRLSVWSAIIEIVVLFLFEGAKRRKPLIEGEYNTNMSVTLGLHCWTPPCLLASTSPLVLPDKTLCSPRDCQNGSNITLILYCHKWGTICVQCKNKYSVYIALIIRFASVNRASVLLYFLYRVSCQNLID